jgi:hypothetical protein
MKFLRLLLFVLTAGILFTSCQKELSAETGSAIGTIAKDAGGNCAPATPSGAYKKDTALNATNFVDIQLDITNVGIYIVTTDTVNGYYFRATGVTPLPGVNIIRLVGFGKPITAGTDLFKVKFNTDVCEFSVPVTGTTGGGTTAIFTFPNGASCTGASQTPNFYVGVPTNAAINTMTIPVIVTQAGTYNLSTTSAGGLTFTGSGTLAIGNQSIVLGASGTPAGPTAGIINYTFSTTTPVASSCGFGLNVQAAPTPAAYTINCGTAATQTGTFQAGTPLTAANKITISVSPATLGAYSITTNTVNGVSYVGAGIFTTVLTQNVDLFVNPLNNTPISAGSFNYATVGGTTICSNVNVTYTGAPTSATFTINCATAATQTGTFVTGTSLPATSKITLSVTPATTGSYTITTNLVNGVSYIGFGNFPTTATQNVDLFASPTNNTPTASGPFVYTTTGGTVACTNVSVTYTAAPATTGFIKANIDGGALTTFSSAPSVVLIPVGSGQQITISADNGSIESFNASVLSTSIIGQGTLYNVNQLLNGNVVTANYTTPTNLDYFAITDVTPQLVNPFTIKFISITATRATGTFSGNLLDNNGAGPGVITFTNGTFDLPF